MCTGGYFIDKKIKIQEKIISYVEGLYRHFICFPTDLPMGPFKTASKLRLPVLDHKKKYRATISPQPHRSSP